MKPSGFYDVLVSASGTANVPVSGDYFKVMSASFPVDIKSTFGELKGLTAGQGLENTSFDLLTIKNTGASAQTVKIFIGDENFIDAFSGNVAITGNILPNASTFAITQFVVTDASLTMLGPEASRKYILLQNKHETSNVYVGFVSALNKTTNTIKIPPGGNWEPSCVPTQAMYAIGDIASNDKFVITRAI